MVELGGKAGLVTEGDRSSGKLHAGNKDRLPAIAPFTHRPGPVIVLMTTGRYYIYSRRVSVLYLHTRVHAAYIISLWDR